MNPLLEMYKNTHNKNKRDDQLNKLGFSKIEFLDVDKADKLYFRQSGGSLHVPLRTNIVLAVV